MTRAIKYFAVAFAMAAGLGLCAERSLPAQENVREGLFGPRTLGVPVAPRTNAYSGIQNGASGDFLYIGSPVGTPAFAMPWRQVDSYITVPIAPMPLLAQQPLLQPATPPALSAGGTPSSSLQLPTALSASPTATMESPASNIAGQTQSPTGVPTVPGLSPAASNLAWQAAFSTAASTTAKPTLARSTSLSDRLTRIAAERKMLVGKPIDVYRVGAIALIQGEVHTMADRALLQDFLMLEPGIWQIDNQLQVKQAASKPALP